MTPAAALDNVEMISYREAQDVALACGPRPEPDPVYLTIRDGAAVAVEFLPRGFVP